MFEILGFSEMSTPLKFVIAFAIVLSLIGLTAWLVRRFGASRLEGGAARGRQPRLAVIDAATVDGRRRLVLIRRDNIEHLLMIGGPTDLVVEPNIVRALGSQITRDPAKSADDNWPLQPVSATAAVAAPRPYRSPATEESWHSPEPAARARPADSLTGLAAELSSRLNPPDHGQPPARSEPAPRNAAPAPSPQNDHNLAEMAQQLEAALRRAPMADGRPPVTDPLAAQAANPQARMPMREFKPRVEPKFESKFEPKFDAKPEPMATPGRQLYDNLEEEMASLLGRPSGKT